MILDPSPDGLWVHGLGESPFDIKRDHAQALRNVKILRRCFHSLQMMNQDQDGKKTGGNDAIRRSNKDKKSGKHKATRRSDNGHSDRALAILTCVQDFLATHCTHPTLVCTLLAVDTGLHEGLLAYPACLLIRLHPPASQKTVFTPNATSTPEKPEKRRKKGEQSNKNVCKHVFK